MDVQNLRRLNGLRSGKLEKRRPDFFQVYLNLYKGVIYNARKSSCLLCGHDFANKRLLLWQFEVYSP